MCSWKPSICNLQTTDWEDYNKKLCHLFLVLNVAFPQKCPTTLFNMTLSVIKNQFKKEAATRDVLCKKVFLEISRNSQEFWPGLGLGLARFRPETVLKRKLRHGCFPISFVKFLRIPFLQNTSGRLLLNKKHFSKSVCIHTKTWGLWFCLSMTKLKVKINTSQLCLIITSVFSRIKCLQWC